MAGLVQLKHNLKVAPGGEAVADVSAQTSMFKLVTSRESVTIPPNGATARRSAAAGTEATDLVITFRANMTAAGLWAVLFEIIKTELDWQGATVEGVPPQYDCEKIECFMQGVRDYLKFLKRGIGRTNHLVGMDIRNGKLTREEVLRLKGELDDIESRRILSPEMKQSRDEFAAALAGAPQPGGGGA